MVTVNLTPSEILIAASWGCFRNVQSWKQAEDRYGAETERDGWQINIMGCIAEMAMAKHTDKYYNAAIGDYNAADVGTIYQIRSSSIAFKHNACLRLHEHDNPDHPYILALVGMSQVLFVGWLWGHQGQKEQYWCDKWKCNRPAFFVEQKDLNSMEDLIYG